MVTGKNRSLWPADSVFVSDPIKKKYFEDKYYLQIHNPAVYAFQLIMKEVSVLGLTTQE